MADPMNTDSDAIDFVWEERTVLSVIIPTWNRRELVRGHPSFGNVFLWRRPSCLAKKPLFRLIVLGLPLLLLLKSPWFLLFAAPFLVRTIWLSSPSATLFVATNSVHTHSAGVMCGSLNHGSVRTHTLVL